MKERYLHVLVSSDNWGQPMIKYRRHRLIEYIQQQDVALDILWVYPASTNLRRPKSYLEVHKLIKNNPAINSQAIKEWALPDCLPQWLMQFKSSYGHPQFKEIIKFVSKYEGKKILWFSYPAFPYLAEMFKWDKVVYDCSDLWVEQLIKTKAPTYSTRFANKLIDQAEKTIISKSDNIFASSHYLAERINSTSDKQAILVENGVDPFFLQDRSQRDTDLLKHIPRPRLGYVGPVRSKIDILLLNEMADLRPEWNFVIVGPNWLSEEYGFRSIIEKENIFWTGEVPYKAVPEYISCLDVGLLPYKEIEYNKAVFPIKYYEYLSQGIPVVGCGLPSTEIHNQKGIYLHVERKHFDQACEEALLWSKNNKPYFQERVKLADAAIWDNKFNYILDQVMHN